MDHLTHSSPESFDQALSDMLVQGQQELEAERLDQAEPATHTLDAIRAELLEQAFLHSAEGQEHLAGGVDSGNARAELHTPKSVLEKALSQAADLPPDAAREIMGMAHELAATGDEGTVALFEEFKQAVYGTVNVEPVPHEGNFPGHEDDPRIFLASGTDQRARALPASHLVEWEGRPIQIQAIEPNPNMHQPYQDTVTTLVMGPRGRWYVQIGEQTPFELESALHTTEDEQTDNPNHAAADTLTLGRNELGGHGDISRDHFRIKPEPPLGVEITDLSSSYTRVVQPDRYPDPVKFQAERDAAKRADAARNTIG